MSPRYSGELYFLLEYRDDDIQLQYSGAGQKFKLPENLWFICTMNTADRSIALMDAALRRRFYFAPFFGDQPPVKGLLQRWLERNCADMSWVADLVDLANERLGERHMSIGPSYFMRDSEELDEAKVRRIWRRAVIPYIEEQFFGNEDRLEEFDFDRLMAELPSGAAEASVDEAGQQVMEFDDSAESEEATEISTPSAQSEEAAATDASTPAA